MIILARLFGGLLGRILAVALALTAAQIPVYYAQYVQTLAGARQEAQARYVELQKEASALNLGAEDFIVRHEENQDPVFQASGRIHRNTLARYLRLNTAWQVFVSASVFERPLVLVRQFDPDIADAVDFTPGVPLTIEAAAYALAGILLAWLISAVFGAILLPSRPAVQYIMPTPPPAPKPEPPPKPTAKPRLPPSAI